MPLPDAQIKEAIARRWDVSSATYDDHAGHGIKSEKESDAWREIFKKALPPDTADVLDAGCGTGELSLLLAEMGYRVTGLDLSQKMLERAKAKADARGLKINFETGDAENPPYDENTFDVVFNRHVLWTLPNPQKALEGWKKILKVNGRAIVVDGFWDDQTINSKARRFTSNLCKIVIEKKNPWKEYYIKELRSSLPNVGGTSLENAKGYMTGSGLRNIGNLDLIHIMEIQRKSMPLSERIRHHFEYYLVFGDK